MLVRPAASAAKHALLTELGASRLVDYRTENYAATVGEVAVVLDLLGGAQARRSAGLLREGGTFVSLFPGDLVAQGRLRVLVERSFPLADVAGAHELLAAGHVTGKLVLVP